MWCIPVPTTGSQIDGLEDDEMTKVGGISRIARFDMYLFIYVCIFIGCIYIPRSTYKT